MDVNTTQVKQLAHALQIGKLVSFPTDTVLALAAKADIAEAIEGIYRLKHRDHQKPLAVMVASLEEARDIAVFNDTAETLARTYWPGALTLVLKAKETPHITAEIHRFTPNIAIRIPDHPVALAILNTLKQPIAATSVNISGEAPAASLPKIWEKDVVTYQNIMQPGGVPSTVVDVTGDDIKILREGELKLTVSSN